MPSYERPIVRLLPKTDPKPFRRGVPWAYANQLVLDRRTKAIEPGSIATLLDAERRPLATIGINPGSKIAARVLDADPEAVIDEAWFRARFHSALALRSRLYDSPYYRLVHAEGDGLPGVVIDRFGDAAVVQPNAAWAERHWEQLSSALAAVTSVSVIVKNSSGRTRGLEGLDALSAVVRGRMSGPLDVPMNGAIYQADLLHGQKTGLFYDQRPNHALAAKLARGGTVLDMFAHVGGFSLAALAAGAVHAVAVDASRDALQLAHDGARKSGVADRFETRQGDAFELLEALGAEGARYDTVICDPPAFAPAKTALNAGLRAYERLARLAAPLVSNGGVLVLCSCSHAVDLEAFRSASLRGVGRAGRAAQILATGTAGPDHPQHPHLAQTGYLKALFLRLLP